MSLELDLRVRIQDVLGVLGVGGLKMPRQVRAAVRSALLRTARHAQTVVRRDTAKAVGAPQKAIRGRFYRGMSPNFDRVSIWVGIFRVALSKFGKPRQTKTGVRVGRLPEFRGAFVGRGKLEGRGVFIRYRSRHYDPLLYGKPGVRAAADPIVRAAGVPIQDEVEKSFAKNEASFRQVFLREFQRLLMHVGRLPWANNRNPL